MTGGRLGRVKDYLNEETFCFTYGDGVADIDISASIRHHNQFQKLVTHTAVQPPGRYGALHLENEMVQQFQEKPDGDNSWINGGFFVVEPSALDWVSGDQMSWEGDILPKLARSGELTAYKHDGFWQPMDTLRDKNRLEELWQCGKAPWRSW